jgi:hypothetical protein
MLEQLGLSAKEAALLMPEIKNKVSTNTKKQKNSAKHVEFEEVVDQDNDL